MDILTKYPLWIGSEIAHMFGTLLIGLHFSPEQYKGFMWIWIGVAVITFIVLLRVTAPYGRHVRPGWGPQINNRLGWILMESPVMLVFLYFILTSWDRQNLVTWTMIGLFYFHYIHRTFIFPFRIHTRGKKMPLIIVGSAIGFNLVNGFGLGYFFKYLADYNITWLSDPRFLFGVVLFVTGMIINWKADTELIRLRKPEETAYVIPRSFLFQKISCPNLFGELVEWLGFALLCWNLPAFAFFIWTVANLVPRALSHHRWYLNTFADYPRERKAILPFWV